MFLSCAHRSHRLQAKINAQSQRTRHHACWSRTSEQGGIKICKHIACIERLMMMIMMMMVFAADQPGEPGRNDEIGHDTFQLLSASLDK